MESPLAIANYFIKKSFDTGQEITPMKVVKLVYIAHGWYLGLSDQPLLSEQVQAWQYGPVIKSVYDEFKIYGSKPITSLAYDYYTQGYGTFIPEVKEEKVKAFLDKVWDVYKNYDGIQLSTLTHQTNTPWDKVWHNGGKNIRCAVISNDLIREHYKNKLAANPVSLQSA